MRTRHTVTHNSARDSVDRHHKLEQVKALLARELGVAWQRRPLALPRLGAATVHDPPVDVAHRSVRHDEIFPDGAERRKVLPWKVRFSAIFQASDSPVAAGIDPGRRDQIDSIRDSCVGCHVGLRQQS